MAGQRVIISITADTRKFSAAMRNLSRETGLSKLTDGFKRLGTRIKDAFKTGIKLAGGLTAAIGGMALAGGIKRALAVEDATFLMEQLGMSTKEISTALEAVDRTFDGTPFANPDGFNFSAQLRASGKGLDQIERDLRTTSNLTAMTLDKDFGRISELFVKMSAKGKVTATDLNSIGLAGYPIRQVLAEALDTSVEGLDKMVRSGDLSYDKLMEILDGVEELDGAAQNLGDNTKVSFSNMLTAFSTVGEKFVTQLLPTFKGVFQDIRGYVRGLRGPAEAAGKAFKVFLEETAIPAVKRLASWLSERLWPVLKNVGDTLKGAFTDAWNSVTTALQKAGFSAGDAAGSFGDTLLTVIEKLGDIVAWVIETLGKFTAWVIENKDLIAGIAVAIGAAVAAFKIFNKILLIVRAAMIVFNIVMAANPIGLIIAAVAALVAALVWFFTQTKVGQKIVTTAWEAIKKAVAVVVDWWNDYVAPVLSAAWEVIKDTASAAAGWFNQHVVPVFEAAGELLGAVFSRIGEWATWLWTDILQPYFQFIMAGWSLLWDGVQAVWEVIGPPLMAYIQTAFEVLWTVLTTIWDNIKNVIETVMGVIRGIIDAVTSIIKGDWKGAWEAIKGIGETVWNGIKRFIDTGINAIRTIISSVVDGIKRMWGDKWNAVKTTALNVFNNIKTGVTDRLNNMMAFVRDIPNKVKNVFSNAGQWLKNAGRMIIDGLINGIKGAFNKVKDTLSSLTSFLPAWKGPASKDRKILVGPGRMIIDGLVRGLESEYSTVKRSLGSLTKTIGSTTFDPLTAPGIRAAGAAGGGTGPVTIQVYAMQDGPEVGRRVHEALEQFYRINGRR